MSVLTIIRDENKISVPFEGTPLLSELLKELNKIKGLGWIRVMYAYPTQMKDELLKTINDCEKVVKYVDIPLQHSHPEMLKLMSRPSFDYRPMIENISF